MSPVSGIPWCLWRDTLAKWAQLSGLPIVWARRETNPAQLSKTYALLDIIAIQQIGLDETQYVFDESRDLLQENLAGVRQVTFNVQVFAPATGRIEESAWIWIDDLVSSFGRNEVQELFKAAGMSRIQTGEAQDISQLEGAQFVSRVTLDVTFLCAYYREDPLGLGTVNRIVGQGDLEGNSDPEVILDVEGP